MTDARQYAVWPIQGQRQCHETLKVWNSYVSNVHLLLHLKLDLTHDCWFLNFWYFAYSFCVTWLWSSQATHRCETTYIRTSEPLSHAYGAILLAIAFKLIYLLCSMTSTICSRLRQIQPELKRPADDDDTFRGKLNFSLDYDLSSEVVRNEFEWESESAHSMTFLFALALHKWTHSFVFTSNIFDVFLTRFFWAELTNFYDDPY